MNLLNQKSGFLFATFAIVAAMVLSTLLAGTIANAQEEITPSSETSTSTPPTEGDPSASPEVSPPCCETATSTAPSGETSIVKNQPPTLSFPTAGSYAGDGIDPNSGDTSTEFTFQVIYTDAENDQPSYIFTHLFGLATTTVLMAVNASADPALHDGNYTNGEQYIAFGKREIIGTHYYAFETSDGNNAVRLPLFPDVAGFPLVITAPPLVVSPPPEERLVFSTNRDGNWELYSMSTDGAGQVNLTSNAAFDIDPGTNVNGSKIVFSSNRGTVLNHLYIMDRDGGNVTSVFTGFAGPVSYREPNFSPNGTKIIATRAGLPPPPGNLGPTEIVMMNTDGTNIVNLSNNPANDSRPVFTPDGSRIVFASDRGNSNGMYDIYIMNADGAQQTRLTFSAADDDLPDVSPDGNKIVFATNRNGNYEIYTMNMDGSDLTRITNNPADEVYPRFSPDGSKITFVSNRDGNFEVYIMNADGSN